MFALCRSAGLRSRIVSAWKATPGRQLALTDGYGWRAEPGRAHATPIGMGGGAEADTPGLAPVVIAGARVVSTLWRSSLKRAADHAL